jgi:multicomponent Na+:H+ antiporter subunit A
VADPSQQTAGPSGAGAWRFAPAVIAAAAFLWFARFLGPVSQGAAPELVLPWVPRLGVDFAFRLDGLSLAFALLITGIGAICLLYASAYFRTDRRLGSLLVILTLFAVSMLGLVTADDAVTLFVFWEGTTITSYLLVGFDHERAKSRAAALQALLVTGSGGLALLAGLLVMGSMAGTFRLSEMNAAGDLFRASAAYPWIFALLMLAAFTKSAQWPFQFWLPGAMAAPTPVSAYLHSATMVKAGVYLLARMSPSLAGTDLWTGLVTPVGLVTMLVSSVWAMRQTDLKMMLAYTTVMALGTMVMLLGTATPMAVTAAMTFLIVHALLQGRALPFGRHDRKGRGHARVSPGRRPRARHAVDGGDHRGGRPGDGRLSSHLRLHRQGTDLQGVRIRARGRLARRRRGAGGQRHDGRLRRPRGAAPVLAPPPAQPKDRPADPGWGLWLGPAVLAALGLAFGLAPHPAQELLVAPMTRAVTGGGLPIELHLWHGVNRALILSLATFAIGFGLYALVDRIRERLIAADPVTPATESGYDAAVAGLARVAGALTTGLQNGLMTSYLRRTFAALAVLIWGALLLGRNPSWPGFDQPLQLIEWAIVAIIVASVVAVLLTSSRLTAIAALGGVGAGIALIFVLFGAIDVAMTQLFVEILLVIFLAIAMVRLPASGFIPFRLGDALVAGALGVGVAVTTLSVLGSELDLSLTAFFETASVPEAFGRNIVNVILVDFRGFDTLGEIAVIVIAGLAAVAALRAGRRAAR